MSLRAMPPWLYRGGQDDYQFNDLVKPEDLQKLPPLDNDESKRFLPNILHASSWTQAAPFKEGKHSRGTRRLKMCVSAGMAGWNCSLLVTQTSLVGAVVKTHEDPVSASDGASCTSHKISEPSRELERERAP
eukprot:sb/3474993/